MMSLKNNDFQMAVASYSSFFLVVFVSWKVHPIALRVPYPFRLVEEDFWIPCHGHCVFEMLLLMMSRRRMVVHVTSEGDYY